jgi:hypothetical protein
VYVVIPRRMAWPMRRVENEVYRKLYTASSSSLIDHAVRIDVAVSSEAFAANAQEVIGGETGDQHESLQPSKLLHLV